MLLQQSSASMKRARALEKLYDYNWDSNSLPLQCILASSDPTSQVLTIAAWCKLVSSNARNLPKINLEWKGRKSQTKGLQIRKFEMLIKVRVYILQSFLILGHSEKRD